MSHSGDPLSYQRPSSGPLKSKGNWTERLKEWKSRGWKTKEKKAVKNEDLWKELDAEASKHQISWKWLKGHAGDQMNEHCDLLARTEILKIKQQFNSEQLKTLLEEFKRSLEPIDLNAKFEGIG